MLARIFLILNLLIAINLVSGKTVATSNRGKGHGSTVLNQISVGTQCYTSYGGDYSTVPSNMTMNCGNNPCYVSYSPYGGIERGCYPNSVCYDGSSVGDYCTNNFTSTNSYYGGGYYGNGYASNSYYSLNFYCCCAESNCNYLDPFTLAVEMEMTPPNKTVVDSCYVNNAMSYSLAPTNAVPCSACSLAYNYQRGTIQRWCNLRPNCTDGKTQGPFCRNLTSITTTVCCCTGSKCNQFVPGVAVPSTTMAPEIPTWEESTDEEGVGDLKPVSARPVVTMKVVANPPAATMKVVANPPAATMKVVANPPAATMKVVANPPAATMKVATNPSLSVAV